MIKNNYQLRPMKTADLSAVLLIEQEQAFPWTAGMLHDCLRADYECTVIEAAQEIIGFSILAVATEQAELLNIVIKNKYQRQGLGQILLQHMIEQAKNNNAVKLFLEVRTSNLPALSLYKKLNFQQINMRKNYYPTTNGREDAYVLMLDLSLIK